MQKNPIPESGNNTDSQGWDLIIYKDTDLVTQESRNQTIRKMHLLRIHSLINPSVHLDSPGLSVLYPKMHAACSLSVLVQELKPCRIPANSFRRLFLS